MNKKLLVLSAILSLHLCAFASVDDVMKIYNQGNFKKAFVEMKRYAEQGNPRAQTNLGVMYRDGEGTSIDYKQALLWAKKAADQNYPDGQYLLGSLYVTGDGGKDDYKKGIALVRLAAKNGSQQAQDVVAKLQPDLDETSQFCLDGRCVDPVPVRAKVGVPSVNGTLICPDQRTLNYMISVHNSYMTKYMQAALMGPEKMKLINGELTPPNLERNGCAVIEPATPMQWNSSSFPAIVRAQLPDGSFIQGVTDLGMIAR